MVKVAACSTLASVAAVFLGSSSTAFAFVVPGGRVVAAPSTKVVAASTSSVSPMSMATAVEPATGSAQQQVPHGGKLVDLMLKTEAEKEKAMKACTSELTLSPRQLCDVELITNGGLSPLDGFMNEEDYNSVVANHRLTNGLLFGLPIVFDTDSEELGPGAHILLKQEGTGLPVATFEVTSKWAPDKALECLKCYGTSQLEHPGTLMVATQRGKYYLGGKLVGLNRPVREFDCASPAEVRDTLPEGKDVVAFQCRNPIHRAHYELFTRALDAENVAKDGVVLVHPTCGPTQADDIPGNVRYLTYVRLAQEVNNPRIRWAYLPYSMHMAGPREALQHMMIRKNFGCTHFIIGRDMAGSKSSVTEEDFYGAYDAQDFAMSISEELNVKCVPSLNLVYTEEEGYVTADEAKERSLTPLKLSGTKFRKMLRAGEDVPEWFAFKSVVEVLRQAS